VTSLTDTHASRPLLAGQVANRPLIAWFLDRVEHYGGHTAFRYKHLGSWRGVTWTAYRGRVEALALGLTALGMEPGDRVAIMGGPTFVEWLYADLALQSVGAISCGIHPKTSASDLLYLLDYAQPCMIVVEDEECAQRVLNLPRRTEVSPRIIVANLSMESGRSRADLLSLEEVENLGRERLAGDHECWLRSARQRRADYPVAILFTSGATGNPKGALLSSRNVIAAWSAIFHYFKAPDGHDRSVALSGFGDISDRVFSAYFPILYGCVAHFAEDEGTLGVSPAEVRPTLLTAPTYMWERTAAQVMAAIESGDRFKRLVYRGAMAIRRRTGEQLWQGASPAPWLRFVNWLAYLTVCRPLLARLGYERVRLALTTGEPLSTPTAKLWHLWGVPVRESYGMAECSGIAALQVDHPANPRSPLRALPGTNVEPSLDGELLLSRDDVFLGYCAPSCDPLSPPAAIGELRTGDVGTVAPEGGFRVVDRRENLLSAVASSGQHVAVAPREVEQFLKLSPHVRTAIVTTAANSRLVALLDLNPITIVAWARKHSISYTAFPDLLLQPVVQDLARQAVASANAVLQSRGQPMLAAFRLLPVGLHADRSLVTGDHKLKRAAILIRFAPLIAEMRREHLPCCPPSATDHPQSSSPRLSSNDTGTR
jgi:long-chain acyl-CoA synthetase